MLFEADGDLLLKGNVVAQGIQMTSDRNLKTAATPLNHADVLARVMAMPMAISG